MAINPNVKVIETVTVGSGGQPNIQFNNIPQTYTDLKLVISARSSSSSAESLWLRMNGLTTGYTGRFIAGPGGNTTAGSGTRTYSAWDIGIVNYNSTTASTFANQEIYIPNYALSNTKSIFNDSVQETNAATAYMYLFANGQTSTAAITSLTCIIADGSNFVQNSTATLYGITSAAVGAKATGGVVTETDTHYVHTFYSGGTFAPIQNITCDYLVVAGGGGSGQTSGGGWQGGAGGAGGYRYFTSQNFASSTNYTVTVGGGGAGGAFNNAGGNQGTNGGNSSVIGGAISITSSGGGGGGTTGTNGRTKTSGRNGGSGGGSAQDTTSNTGGSGNLGGYTPVEGYAGGNVTGGAPYIPGTGGGSSAAGSQVSDGAANNGTINSISGAPISYACGGSYGGSTAVVGTALTGNANATSYTGNGGNTRSNGTDGTWSVDGAGWNGGSGIVIIRYAK